MPQPLHSNKKPVQHLDSDGHDINENPRKYYTMAAWQSLVRKMISGWPRRGRNLLELNCEDGFFLENFWEVGFDVTGQEQNPFLLNRARKRMGKKASIIQSNTEHLPYDDNSFDYVVCLHGFEWASDTRPIIAEAFRLAKHGVMLAFTNAVSWYGLQHHAKRLIRRKSTEEAVAKFMAGDEKAPYYVPMLNPFKILSQAKMQNKNAVFKWGSNLIGPAWSWRYGFLCSHVNMLALPLPLGVFAVLRADLSPMAAGTSLLLHSKHKGNSASRRVLGELGSNKMPGAASIGDSEPRGQPR